MARPHQVLAPTIRRKSRLFWLESSPLKWSRIARTVAADKGLDLWQSARLFAILDMALADGYVAMSASKNHYNFWRPVTAIQSSGGDANWTPLQTHTA